VSSARHQVGGHQWKLLR